LKLTFARGLLVEDLVHNVCYGRSGAERERWP